jgi:hypothetical protein
MIPSAPTQTVFGRRSPSRRGATSRPGPFDRLGLGLDRRLEPAALFPRPERWSSPRPIEMRRRSAAASTVFWSLSSVTSRQASSRTPSVWAVRGSRPAAASRGTTSVPQPVQRKRPRRSSISPTSLTRRRGAQPFAFIEALQAVQAAGTTRSASSRANGLAPEGHPGLGEAGATLRSSEPTSACSVVRRTVSDTGHAIVSPSGCWLLLMTRQRAGWGSRLPGRLAQSLRCLPEVCPPLTELT